MTCPDCGHENPEGARFCSNCGVQLAKVAEPAKKVHDVEHDLSADVYTWLGTGTVPEGGHGH